MIKRNQRYFNWINRLMDMAVYCLCYELAVLFWIYWLHHDSNNIAIRYAFDNVLPLMILSFSFIVLFQSFGMYDSYRFQKISGELWLLFKLHCLCILLGIGCVFLFKRSSFSRGVMISFAVFSYVALCLKRVILRAGLQYIRTKGYNQKHVVLVGDGHLAKTYLKSIQQNPQLGFLCDGYVGHPDMLQGCLYLGSYDQFTSILEEYAPDEVIVTLEEMDSSLMNSIIFETEKTGIRVSIVPVFNDYLPSSATVDAIGAVRLINLRSSAQDITLNRILKRAFDILFSATVLLLISPLLLVTAMGVWLSSPGPIFFKQVRMGKDRKLFTMYKFRSMRINDASDTAWSSNSDNRRTFFGSLIRKFSIDELPQFFNVLKGDMSVVGPRPEIPHFVDQYREMFPLYMVKHQVKPGITGWAQVNGLRGDTSIEKRVEYDIWYIENWSILLDFKIIFKTVFGGMMNEETLSKAREKTSV